MHNLHHLPVGRKHFRNPQLLVFEREILGGDDLVFVIGAKRGHQFVTHPHCQTIRKSVDRRNIDCDRGRMPLVDQFAQQLPLRLAINFAIGRVGIPIDGIQTAIGIAAECEPLQRLVRAAIVEHIDGGAARSKHRGRNQRKERWILGILAAGDNPHLRSMLPHENRQIAFQPQPEPLLLDASLIAQRRKRGNLGKNYSGEKNRSKSTAHGS